MGLNGSQSATSTQIQHFFLYFLYFIYLLQLLYSGSVFGEALPVPGAEIPKPRDAYY